MGRTERECYNFTPLEAEPAVCFTSNMIFPVDIPQEVLSYSCVQATGGRMTKDRSEILQGTLDLMVLKTLDAMGPLHGYGIARRIEQISE